MLWVVQNDLYNEYNYDVFLKNLQRHEIDHVIVKVVPFYNKLIEYTKETKSGKYDLDNIQEAEIDDSRSIIVMGSITLGKIAKERGWTPGIFQNENFDFKIWSEIYKDVILSENAIVGKVKEISNVNNLDWMFVRPVHDTKALVGTIMSKHDFHDWRLGVSIVEDNGDTPLHKDTEILIAPVQKIYTEGRCFVVDGKIVASSLYKRGGTLIREPVIDKMMNWFTEEMIARWQPARAFVIDIADTPKGYKVIEINTFNSAGFYDADTSKIIIAVDNMRGF